MDASPDAANIRMGFQRTGEGIEIALMYGHIVVEEVDDVDRRGKTVERVVSLRGKRRRVRV